MSCVSSLLLHLSSQSSLDHCAYRVKSAETRHSISSSSLRTKHATISQTNTHTHTLSLSLTHTHTHTLSLSHTHTLSLSLHTHTHTHSLSHTHIHSCTHTLTHTLSHTHTHTHTHREREREMCSYAFCVKIITLAMFPSTYFYAHFGISQKKKKTGWKRQDVHKL